MTTPPTQTVFARLTRDNPDLTDRDRQIMRAFERLLEGQPEITDGSVTAMNIAAEAGISRASYYRSPVAAAVKEILATPQIKRPEVDELKTELTRLRREMRMLRRDRAVEIRELKNTVATYANQIQALALHTEEFADDARKLRAQLAEHSYGVLRPLR
ncbi:hypothetical protein OG944_04110 [Streptomyces anulatus]|uniref:hypothetical protein n=1 Tax=Streptomyces TaxID=1883 RepID=UPI000BFC5C9E|nr:MULTISPECIES: hypothetical protein [Streptomyces]MCX4502174.1 hypothetical protein [Streptomyces anulatus]WTC75276.1 hypothetical protein OG882_35025 [Streptomyces anulatus]WUD87337.1 hypothetical protein OG703_03985 [Streptomyces anulatus]